LLFWLSVRKRDQIAATIAHHERLTREVKGETEASIKNKLARGTFAATFLLGVLAALELEGVRLDDI
jgi:hypothetical protein